MSDCYTCELVTNRDMGVAPLWDTIHRGQHWDLAHSYNTALPGWLVLISRRHMTAIDEMTEDEAAELGALLRQSSVALKKVTGCLKTYVVQFAEAVEHPHVHFHVVPRMAEQPEERRGPGIFGYLGVSKEERVSEETMNDIALRVRAALT